MSYVRRGGKLGGCWLFTELPGFPCGNFWRLYNYFKRKSNINRKANLVQPLHRATSEHAPRGIRRASSARRSRVNREEVGGARRGGAGRRRARAVPRPGERRQRAAHAQSRPRRPLSTVRGVQRGASAPPRGRLFRQLGVLPAVLSRRGSPAALPRSPRRGAVALEPPARRVCAVSVSVAVAGPAPPSPPPPGLVSVSRPVVRPSTPALWPASSLWSPEPPCLSVPLVHASVRSQDGQPLPRPLVSSFVCAPAATGPSPLGPR